MFNSRSKGNLDLYVKPSSGAGNEELLLDEAGNLYPESSSPDGRSVLYAVGAAGSSTGGDERIFPLSGDGKSSVFLQTPFNEAQGRFSPNGRWVAYVSNESGRNEVYVAPFPSAGGKWLISRAGGSSPRWRRDGRELFYLAPDSKLIAVPVNGQGSAFQVDASQVLFEARPRLGANCPPYDVAVDGQRFLINTLVEQPASPPITLIVNWTAGLTK